MKNRQNKKMVDKLREIRDKVSNEIKDMSFDQLIEYLNKQKGLHPVMKNEEDPKDSNEDEEMLERIYSILL